MLRRAQFGLGLSILSGKYFHGDKPERPEKLGYVIEGAVEEGAGPAEASIADALNAMPAAELVAAGEKAFAKCQSCHTVNAGGANGIGPNLHGVMGKPFGAQAGFAAPWFRAAQRLSEPVVPAPAFASRLAAPDADWLTIEPSQLLHCFKHPARYLLEQRLGLHLAQGTEVLAGDEPFSVEWTSQHGLRQLALQAIEQNWTEPQERAVAAASGWLPVGELGQAYWGQIRGPIRAFAPTLFDERPAEAAQPLLVDITLAGVRIHGWLEGVTDEGLFDYRLRDLGAWELAPFWLRHLLLNCAATPGIRRDSRLLSPKSEWRLGPLANPLELLQPWLEAYQSALCEPLPLLAKCSVGFAKKWRKPGRKEPIDAARSEAALMWQGNEHMSGEGDDPWNALAFRDREAEGHGLEGHHHHNHDLHDHDCGPDCGHEHHHHDDFLVKMFSSFRIKRKKTYQDTQFSCKIIKMLNFLN